MLEDNLSWRLRSVVHACFTLFIDRNIEDQEAFVVVVVTMLSTVSPANHLNHSQRASHSHQTSRSLRLGCFAPNWPKLSILTHSMCNHPNLQRHAYWRLLRFEFCMQALKHRLRDKAYPRYLPAHHHLNSAGARSTLAPDLFIFSLMSAKHASPSAPKTQPSEGFTSYLNSLRVRQPL